MDMALSTNDSDEDKRRPLGTPKPVVLTCNECGRGAQLLRGLCEPCFRNTFVVPRMKDRDALLTKVSNVSIAIIGFENELKDAKIAYNKAQTQNWSCARCSMRFDYYGNLFAHEKECKPPKTPRTAADRRAARVSQRIVV